MLCAPASAQISVSPTSLTFGSSGTPSTWQTVGTQSSSQTITLHNTSVFISASYPAFSFSVADFGRVGGTCNPSGGSLAANASCTILVAFAPITSGTRSGSILVSSTPTVTLTGYAQRAPRVSPTSINFGSQVYNVRSAGQYITYYNDSAVSRTITSFSASGDFAFPLQVVQPGQCTANLVVAAGGSCTLPFVAFTPSALGVRNGSVTVVDSAPLSPRTTTLSGTGIPPADATPDPLNFGSVLLGNDSSYQTVTYTNSSNASITISSVTISGQFNIGISLNRCVASLVVAAGGTCNVIVRMSPVTAGALSGTLTIADNAAFSPRTVSLLGTGTTGSPDIQPSSHAYGNQLVGTSSSTFVFNYTNHTAGTVSITTLTLPAGYVRRTVGGDCAVSGAVSSAGSCNIAVAFSPVTTGTFNGNLSITDNAPAALVVPRIASLTGVGVPPATVSPTSINFGSVNVSTTSHLTTVTYTNQSGAPITINSINVTGPFNVNPTLLNGCIAGLTVAAAGTCGMQASFSPVAAGLTFGSISIADSAALSPRVVSLSGTGVLNPDLSPDPHSFGTIPEDTTGTPFEFVYKNFSNVSVTVTSIGVSGPFVLTTAATIPCSVNLVVVANGSCRIGVAYAPTNAGNDIGTLTVTDTAPLSPRTSALTGTATANPTLLPSSTSFGTMALGSRALTKTFTYTNASPVAVTLQSIGLNTANFGFLRTLNECITGATIQPGSSCFLLVTFLPPRDGAFGGALTVTDSGFANPRRSTFSATAVIPATLTPPTLTFAPQNIGAVSPAQFVTMTNPSVVTIRINTIGVSGDFIQPHVLLLNACVNGLSLASGASCTIAVAFTPHAAGTRTGTLSVTDSTGLAAHTVSLTGTGNPNPLISPTVVAFAPQTVGTTSVAKIVSYINQGTSPVTLNSISVTGNDFTLSTRTLVLGPCQAGAIIPVGGSCRIAVAFAPSGGGALNGTLTVTDSAPLSPRTAALIGTGSLPPALSPAILQFNPTNQGSTSPPQTLQYANLGATSVTITRITVTPDPINGGIHFTLQSALSSPCRVGLILIAGGTCNLNVAFSPTDVGGLTGTVTVDDTAPFSPRSTSLSGTGVLAPNPAPTVFRLLPFGVVQGSGPFTLSVVGANFVRGTVVNWNGQARPTTVVNANLLTINVSASDVATRGTAGVSVFTPAPGGGTSGVLQFTISGSAREDAATAPPVIETPDSQNVDSSNAPSGNITPPCGNGSTSHGVWFHYTPPADGQVTLDMDGSNYQTITNVFTGQPGALVPIPNACTQATVVMGANHRVVRTINAKTTFNAGQGQSVWVLVTATNNDGGALNFNIGFRATSALSGNSYTTVLPHVPFGGGYRTKITMVNLSGDDNNTAVNFIGQDGSIVATRTVMMHAGETIRIATDDTLTNGLLTVQWATVVASGRIVANLFYEITDPNQAGRVINSVGFNDDPGDTGFTLPVEFEPAPPAGAIGRTVGVAIANPNNSQVPVTLELHDASGANLGTRTINLAPYGQQPFALDASNLFQGVLPAQNFTGVVRGAAPMPVSIVAVGDDLGPFFATPPMNASSRVVIPHIVSGGGFVTKLTLTNQSSSQNDVTITYYDQQGNVVDDDTYTLAGYGTVRIATPEEDRFGPVSVKWAVVNASQNVGVNLFFEFEDQQTESVINTIGFNDAEEYQDFTLPAEFEPGNASSPGRTVGVAIANANGDTAHLTLTLLRADGTAIATSNLTIVPNGQIIASLQSLPEFAAVLPNGNFIGAVWVHSDVPVAAVALEDDLGPFSAIPVVSGKP